LEHVSARTHICPGKDIAVLYAKLFCYNLLRRCTWEFAEPVEWDERKYSLNVAAPKGVMRTRHFVYNNGR
jgi:cytochrome P450